MRAWHVTRGSWHAWHLWRWTMRCGDVQRSGDIVTRVTRVMDSHVPGCERYYIVHSQGWWGYIYIHPGIMISGSMVMMIAASTVQWHYLSRTFHDVGVSSPSERTFKILFRKGENTFTIFHNYLQSTLLFLWLFDFWSLNLPSQVSWHSWVYLRVLEPALPQSLQRPKTPRSAASHTAVHRTVHAALQQQQISRVVFQIPGLFILRTIFRRINIFGNILQGN